MAHKKYNGGGRIAEIEKEISEYQELIKDNSVPQDEKDFAKSEISDLEKELSELKKAPAPASAKPAKAKKEPKPKKEKKAKVEESEHQKKVNYAKTLKKGDFFKYKDRFRPFGKELTEQVYHVYPESEHSSYGRIIGIKSHDEDDRSIIQKFDTDLLILPTKDKKDKKDTSALPSCDELAKKWEERKAAAKKANKAHKTVSISERIGTDIAHAVKKIVDNVPVADIKAAPTKYIEKFKKVETTTKEFLDSLKSLLGDDFDRKELLEPFEQIIGKFIANVKKKYE